MADYLSVKHMISDLLIHLDSSHYISIDCLRINEKILLNA